MDMAEIEVLRLEQKPTKIRNVPISATPEGFWCCPSPLGFQKSVKPQNPPFKPKYRSTTPNSSFPKKHNSAVAERRPVSTASKPAPVSEEKKAPTSDGPVVGGSVGPEQSSSWHKIENMPRKLSIDFGEPGTSDLKLIFLGKQGFVVKLSVHRRTLVENSTFFAKKIIEQQPVFPCIKIDDCVDVEAYVETVGLMYCPELKQRLMKQSVSRVLRILKIAELLGFSSCFQSCLEYLEAVPWVGDEEEKVVSSVLHLQIEGIGAAPVLKRVLSHTVQPQLDTLSHILDLVLKSNEDRGRREMKSVVLMLLRDNSSFPSHLGSVDIFYNILYDSCRSCLGVLLTLFSQAADVEFSSKSNDCKDPAMKLIAQQTDNILWLLDILADRQSADEFAMLWASQQELALLHMKLPLASRYHVSCITARLFVGIGRGELLTSKDTRHLLLQIWLQPLIDDYSWLQHGFCSFDIKVVEEGIGRTILTLPLEDQLSILLAWLGSILKAGDSCPNLKRAFEVWWRRTFIRPYIVSGNLRQSGSNVVE